MVDNIYNYGTSRFKFIVIQCDYIHIACPKGHPYHIGDVSFHVVLFVI